MALQNDVGTIIRTFLPELLKKKGVSAHQLKVISALANCRTAQMGGSAMVCKQCGSIHYFMHSCRNRHCPRCQGIDKELWIEDRKHELLPVKYFHVVFTVPHDLLELFRFNRQIMYNLLFEKSWQTLCIFAKDPKLLGRRLGAIAILHTWDQQLKFHPHIHFIIPAGGVDNIGRWKCSKKQGKFLFNVKHLSSKFSALFAEKLRILKQQGRIKKFVPRDLIKKSWVVYAKQAFGKPQNVVEYLGRYTHRVAISNARIVKVTDTHVTFRWYNRKKNYALQFQTLSGVEFLERFLDHIVPAGFRRIRHLGFLCSRNKKEALNNIRAQLIPNFTPKPRLTRAEVLMVRFGQRSVLQCRECGSSLIVFEYYTKQRAPPLENPA